MNECSEIRFQSYLQLVGYLSPVIVFVNFTWSDYQGWKFQQMREGSGCFRKMAVHSPCAENPKEIKININSASE